MCHDFPIPLTGTFASQVYNKRPSKSLQLSVPLSPQAMAFSFINCIVKGNAQRRTNMPTFILWSSTLDSHLEHKIASAPIPGSGQTPSEPLRRAAHMASRARTRAAESYRMAVSLGQAKVSLTGFWSGFRRDLAGFDRFLRGLDRFVEGSSTGLQGF